MSLWSVLVHMLWQVLWRLFPGNIFVRFAPLHAQIFSHKRSEILFFLSDLKSSMMYMWQMHVRKENHVVV